MRHARPRRIAWLKYPLYLDQSPVRRAIHRADQLCCAAPYLVPKVRNLYGLTSEPPFLPTPVHVPDGVAAS